jgi:pimeloyl-ACP methyl ester carboxylesterase
MSVSEKFIVPQRHTFPQLQVVGAEFLAQDGVLHPPNLEPVPESDYNLDPIINREQRAVGTTVLHKLWSTTDPTTLDTRYHRLYSVEHTENHAIEKVYRHGIAVTDPVGGSFDNVIISFPGFTETIEGTIRKQLQEHLSYQFPRSRIVSVASDGIGATGDRYTWYEREKHSVEEMGRTRLEIAKDLAGDTAVYGMGTSMGSIILHHMTRENLATPSSSDHIDLRGNYLLSPALVDPKNIIRDMGVLFLPMFVGDTLHELFAKTAPKESITLMKQLGHYGLIPYDAPAMLNQLIGLFLGTKESDVADVIEQVPTVVVAGERDPVAQWHMWRRIEKRFPEQLYLEVVAGRGHGLPMKPSNACRKMAASGTFIAGS